MSRDTDPPDEALGYRRVALPRMPSGHPCLPLLVPSGPTTILHVYVLAADGTILYDSPVPPPEGGEP